MNLSNNDLVSLMKEVRANLMNHYLDRTAESADHCRGCGSASFVPHKEGCPVDILIKCIDGLVASEVVDKSAKSEYHSSNECWQGFTMTEMVMVKYSGYTFIINRTILPQLLRALERGFSTSSIHTMSTLSHVVITPKNGVIKCRIDQEESHEIIVNAFRDYYGVNVNINL